MTFGFDFEVTGCEGVAFNDELVNSVTRDSLIVCHHGNLHAEVSMSG
jgi:hypothetical protein